MSGHFKKLDWKGIVKKSINTYWTTKLQQDCQSKSSLSLLSTTSLEMGKTHIVWDVRKAITKARMLTGTYMLQTLKSKFNQAEVDPTCPICRLETETMTHVITNCPVYNEIRKEYFVKIKGTVITSISFDSWKRNFNKKDIICQLVIDSNTGGHRSAAK
jgi:DNA-directed RNA polymerase specialized sigma54-like protein